MHGTTVLPQDPTAWQLDMAVTKLSTPMIIPNLSQCLNMAFWFRLVSWCLFLVVPYLQHLAEWSPWWWWFHRRNQWQMASTNLQWCNKWCPRVVWGHPWIPRLSRCCGLMTVVSAPVSWLMARGPDEPLCWMIPDEGLHLSRIKELTLLTRDTTGATTWQPSGSGWISPLSSVSSPSSRSSTFNSHPAGYTWYIQLF